MSLVNGEHARVAQFLGLHMLGPDNFLSFKRDKDLKIESANQARDLIASVINGFTNMEALELCMNSIGVAASEVIGNALANKPELKACLFDDIFKQRTIPETGPALKNLLDGIQLAGARLVYLNLSDNALGPSVIEYYREFLQSEACFSLQYLNLNNCGMGSSILTVSDSLIECKRRAAAAGVQFQLRVFIAGRNRLEDPGAFALSRAFKELGTLQHVSLPQDGIRPDGIKALAKSFAANRDLRVIDIGDNCCNVSGAKAMCTVLQRLPFVEVLNFADCLFKTKGGTYFLEAMRSGLDNVREVNLSGNEIDANVAKQLLDCARQKVNLKQLRIGTNRFGRQLTEIRSVASGMGDLSVDVGESSDNEGTASEDGEEADESSAAQSADDLSDDPPPLLAAQIANALAQQHDQHQSSSGAHQNSAGGGSGVWSRLGPRVDASHSTHNGTHGFDESGEVVCDDDEIVVDESIVQSFFDNPSYELLESMHPDPAAYLLSSREVEYMLSDAVCVVDLIVTNSLNFVHSQLSSLVTRDTEERIELVGNTIILILLGSVMVNEDQPVYGPMDPNSMIVNHLIARLRFIKADTDSYSGRVAVDNYYGLFRVLEHIIHHPHDVIFQPNYPTLKFWFERGATSRRFDGPTKDALNDVLRALQEAR